MTSPKIKAPELATSQANKEETVNEAVRHAEAFASSVTIENDTNTAPPGTCADGACYIVAASPTGAWTGKATQVAIAIGTNASNGWKFVPRFEGMQVYNRALNTLKVFDGTNYQPISGGVMDDIADVNAPAPDVGDVITWDGTEYVAAPPPGSGGGAGGTVPAGGITGQALVKLSGVDNDTGWGGAGECDFNPPTLATHATERKTATAFTASAADVTGRGMTFSLQPTGTGDKVIARLKAAPTAPFQIDVRMRQTAANGTGEAGLILYNSTNGRSLRLLQLTTGQLFSQTYSNLETFAATNTASPTGVAVDLHAWLRVTVDASGNVAFFYSRDGGYYKGIGTTTLATYLTASGGGTLDEVGVYARANGNGLGSGATFHWYKES